MMHAEEPGGQKAHEKVFNIISPQGNVNKNHNEVTLHTHEDSYDTTIMTTVMENKYWQGYGEIGALLHCCWECKMVWLVENSLAFVQKVKQNYHMTPLRSILKRIESRHTIPFLGLYPKELKKYKSKHICAHVNSNVIRNNQKVETVQMSING